MARDRKRAKQRRDRRERRPPAPRGGVRTDVRRPEEAEEELLEAPEPLEHASAEVDLAEAQLAAGRPEPDDDEEPLSEEELTEAAEEQATAAGGGDFRGAGGSEVYEDEEEPLPAGRAPARRPREVPGNRVVAFLQGSWRELQRVQWPDRRQVAQATGVVIVFVIIAGLFLGLVDALSQKIVDAIL
jgi:preprotein translocase subunit SecE